MFKRCFESHGTRLVAAILLVMHLGMVSWAILRTSATFNEPAHLAAGLDYWARNRVELYKVNPPLTRAVATLPVFVWGISPVPDSMQSGGLPRSEFYAGSLLVHTLGSRFADVLVSTRLFNLVWTVLGLGVCYLWSNDLYGHRAAILATALWTFHPMIAAHAGVLTPDIGATACALSAGYFFFRFGRRADLMQAVLCGTALGLAALSKFTLLPLILIYPAIWITGLCRDGKWTSPLLPRMGRLVVVLAVALHLVNSAYFYQGTGTPLKEIRLISTPLRGATEDLPNRFSNSHWANIPIPVPLAFVQGIDLQLDDVVSGRERCYIHGHWQSPGPWYYYLYGALVKQPMGFLALMVMSLFSLRWRSLRHDELYLIVPAITTLCLLSRNTEFMHHTRYLLPAIGWMLVFASRVAATDSNDRAGLPPWRSASIAALVCASAVSMLAATPHYLSYFPLWTRMIPGSRPCLLYSDLDWGQGLRDAQRWLANQDREQPVHLAYMGLYDPSDIGFMYRAPRLIIDENGRRTLPRGWHLVSINLLEGQLHAPPDSHGRSVPYDASYYAALNQLAPVATFANCMRLYAVGESE